MMLAVSTVILNCPIITRLFHLVSSLLEGRSSAKSIKPRKDRMVALEEMEIRELIGRMIMWIFNVYLEGIVPLPNDDLIAAYRVKSIK